MARYAAHMTKAELCWTLAQEQYEKSGTPFICMNLTMYTVGHLVEAMLAREGRHPVSPPRGVPHGDRDMLLRKVLIGRGKLESEWGDRYSELVAQRDTFIDGGNQDRAFIERYMALARPFIDRLHVLTTQTL